MFATSLQDLQSPQYHTRLVHPSAGVHTCGRDPLPQWVCRPEQWRIPRTFCGRQTPQGVQGGLREHFQGTFHQIYALSISLLSFRTVVMSRDHQLETFVPSEYLALVGGICVHRPALFPHLH